MSVVGFLRSLFPPRFDRKGSSPAYLVVTNARIVTCDPDNPRARAVAVNEERITYVGDRKGVADYVGPGTKVIDARGKTLTPGFVDNHCHVLWVSAALSMTTDLLGCNSMDEVKSSVLAEARKNPDMPFVFGFGWKFDYIPDGVPDRSMLDDIISDRLVILWHRYAHAGWANTLALELMQERNPEAYRMLMPETDEKTGEPTGLFDFFAFSPTDFFSCEELGKKLQEKMIEAMGKTMNDALALGVTTMNDVQISPSFIPMVLKFKQKGGLEKARVRCSYFIDQFRLEDEEKLIKDLESWKELGERESDSHLVLGDSVKLYIDGILSNHTMLLKEPYCDRPDLYGHASWSQQDFNRVVEIIDSMGLQACTHATGDGGIPMVIDAYQRAREVNGQRDSRHRIEHCELPRREDMERMARLSIHAAMQPVHFFGDEDYEKTIGEERLRRMMPWRSLEKAGVDISFGSDYCAGPLNPVYGLIVSGTRINYKGNTDWGPEEKLELENSIRHWTVDSAEALMMEKEIGSVKVGKYGDMVLWNQDPLRFSSWWFLLTHKTEQGALDDFVDVTLLGGETVYNKEERDRL